MPSKEEYAAARALVTEAKAKAREMVQKVFTSESRSLLDELGIESFGWRQYTPYFNDGDACVFRAHTDSDSVYVNNRDSYGETGYYDPDMEDEEEEERPEKKFPDYRLRETDPDEYKRQLDEYYGVHGKVSEFLQQYAEEDLEFMFGDHVIVTVTRDGIETEDYEHD